MNKKFEIHDLNCLIDLHLHLDGSLSVANVKELAKLQNIEIPNDLKELISLLKVSDDCRDLNDYLTKFSFPCSLLQTKEAIALAIYNLKEELKDYGLMYVEIRFAPQKHTEKGLSQRDVVMAAIEGSKRSSLKSNIILCMMRGNDNFEENYETIEVAKEFLNKGVCAIDLAGAESLFKTCTFEPLFTKANEYNIPLTIHAGEADGPESIKDAIRFGAKRIGHGVRCLEDSALSEYIKKENILLETCPISNLNTSIYQQIHEFPIKEFLNRGIKITINTDNISVSNGILWKVFNNLNSSFNLSIEELRTLLLNAANGAFCDEKTKENMINQINKEIDYYI